MNTSTIAALFSILLFACEEQGGFYIDERCDELTVSEIFAAIHEFNRYSDEPIEVDGFMAVPSDHVNDDFDTIICTDYFNGLTLGRTASFSDIVLQDLRHDIVKRVVMHELVHYHRCDIEHSGNQGEIMYPEMFDDTKTEYSDTDIAMIRGE